MIGSLKAYAPQLALRLGTTPAALYERQRALVRTGILEQPEGRGPGSGIQVGPYEVALLLIAVLATDSLSETTEKVRTLANAKSIADNGLCPVTGASTFVEAVASVLDMTLDHWREIVGITVHRTVAKASINYKARFHQHDSTFAAQLPRVSHLRPSTRLRVDATLSRDLIIDIATDLKKIADAERNVRAAALQGIAESELRTRAHDPRRRGKQSRPNRGKRK